MEAGVGSQSVSLLKYQGCLPAFQSRAHMLRRLSKKMCFDGVCVPALVTAMFSVFAFLLWSLQCFQCLRSWFGHCNVFSVCVPGLVTAIFSVFAFLVWSLQCLHSVCVPGLVIAMLPVFAFLVLSLQCFHIVCVPGLVIAMFSVFAFLVWSLQCFHSVCVGHCNDFTVFAF